MGFNCTDTDSYSICFKASQFRATKVQLKSKSRYKAGYASFVGGHMRETEN